jgi:hypothetical protein
VGDVAAVRERLIPTLDYVREAASPGTFPPYVLDGCPSALLLFCAGFHGRYDGVHVLDAGVPEVTAIDFDPITLDEMRGLYPSAWEFECADAYECPLGERAWDLVCVDPPSDHALRAPERLERWCGASSRWVVMGVMARWFREHDLPLVRDSIAAPGGFRAHDLRRRNRDDGGVFWAVLEREG